MNKDVTKSKEFKEKEAKLRENLRQVNEGELIGDFTRLFEEKLFCDVNFVVESEEFPAHVSILHARAPKFSDKFLSGILSPSVQSCINIPNLQRHQFSTFLRSVYAQNDIQDYSTSSHNWGGEDVAQRVDDLESHSKNEFEDSLDECISTSSALPDSFNNKAQGDLSYEPCCKMGQDLISLVDDTKSCDVKFVLNDNKVIHAHRAIICARSSYFSAMLYGDWTEKHATEIPLTGISHQALLIVMYFLYGGITKIPLENCSDLCDVLYLADMYGLTGLKQVVLCELKLFKCHLFHKPCPDCIVGILECLELSEIFHLIDLKKQCLKWTVKYFDRVYNTKSFAYTSSNLQQEIHSNLQSSINRLNVIDVLYREEKLESSVPRIKWSEPVLELISLEINFCLSFIADNFPVIVSDSAFCNMMKGVGWSTPLLEKIFIGVWDSLTVNNCCERLKVARKLQIMLKMDNEEEKESVFSEEVCSLVERFYSKCQKFIVSNLHRVTHTGGWNHLSPRTQIEIKKSEGGVFVDLGLPSQRTRTFPSSNKRPSSSLRATTVKHNTGGVGATGNFTSKPRPKSAGLPGSSGPSKTRKPNKPTGTNAGKRPSSALATRTCVSTSTRNQPETSVNERRTRTTLLRTGNRNRAENKTEDSQEVTAKTPAVAACSKRLSSVKDSSSKSTSTKAFGTSTRRISDRPLSANRSGLPNSNDIRSVDRVRTNPRLSTVNDKRMSLNCASNLSTTKARETSKSKPLICAKGKASNNDTTNTRNKSAQFLSNKSGDKKLNSNSSLSNATKSYKNASRTAAKKSVKNNEGIMSTAEKITKSRGMQERHNCKTDMKSVSTACALNMEDNSVKRKTQASNDNKSNYKTHTRQNEDIHAKSELLGCVLQLETDFAKSETSKNNAENKSTVETHKNVDTLAETRQDENADAVSELSGVPLLLENDHPTLPTNELFLESGNQNANVNLNVDIPNSESNDQMTLTNLETRPNANLVHDETDLNAANGSQSESKEYHQIRVAIRKQWTRNTDSRKKLAPYCRHK